MVFVFEYAIILVVIIMDESTKKMFIDICNELDIKCIILSKDWVFMLEKNNITRFLYDIIKVI